MKFENYNFNDYLVFRLICKTPSNILSVNNIGKQEHRNVVSRTNRL